MRGPRPLSAWLSVLTDAVLSTDPGARQRELAAGRAPAASSPPSGSAADPEPQLRLSDVRALLAGRLGGRPTRSNFRTGNLTVCTMVPMRSVPHRVVCLLGLDDGVFPRAAHPDGDDVLARDAAGRRTRPSRRGPAVAAGRDPRGDRASGHHLQRRGRAHRCGPAAVRSRRRAARRARRHRRAGRTADARRPGRRPASAAAVRRPQRHHRRSRPRSAVQLRPRRARRRPGAGRRAAAARPVPRRAAAHRAGHRPRAGPAGRAAAEPGPGFLRQRLDVAVPYEEKEPAEAIPVALDGLQKWGIGDSTARRPSGGHRPRRGDAGGMAARCGPARPARPNRGAGGGRQCRAPGQRQRPVSPAGTPDRRHPDSAGRLDAAAARWAACTTGPCWPSTTATCRPRNGSPPGSGWSCSPPPSRTAAGPRSPSERAPSRRSLGPLDGSLPRSTPWPS